MNIGGSKIIKKSANLVMQYIRKDAERILITYLIDLRRENSFSIAAISPGNPE